MTYNDCMRVAEERGSNMPEVAIGRMMDLVGEETGVWPDWDDQVPAWIEEEFR